MKINVFLLLIILILSSIAVHGQTNRALSFDGINDYVDLGNSNILKPELNFTVEIWAAASNWSASSVGKLFSCTEGGGYSMQFSGGNIVFYVFSPNYGYRNASSNVSGLTGWHHFAGVYSQGRYIRLYIDGELVNTFDLGSENNAVLYYNENHILIGAEAGNTSEAQGEYFQGAMDEFRIWNKARTQEEIKRSMTVEIPADADGLAAYYKMDGYSSTILYDNSLNSNDGTVINYIPRINSGTLKAYKPDMYGTSYIIRDKYDLYWLSHCPDAWSADFNQFVDIIFLESDFNQSSFFYDEGKGFLPIGTFTHPFTGTYSGGYTGNGNGLIKIDGLYMNRPNQDYTGFFGYIKGGAISNIEIANANITGQNSVAALAASIDESTSINYCSVSGTVTGNVNTGGLIGHSLGSTVNGSYAACTTTGVSSIGGVVGWLDNSELTNSYNAGNTVRAESSPYISIAPVTGYNTNAVTKNCYSTGQVSCGGLTNKGFSGVNENAVFENNFFNTETSLQLTGEGATGITSAEMRDIKTFTDETTAGLTTAWDFLYRTNDDDSNMDYWDMDQDATVNNGFPILTWQNGADDILFDYNLTGSGSYSDPFIISSLEELKILSEDNFFWHNNFFIKQTADIDASGTLNWNNNEGFSPIGNSTTPFEGTYLGNGKVIDGLTIKRPNSSNVGMFGIIGGNGSVQDFGLTNANISGDKKVGVLVGYIYSYQGRIKNCLATGNATGNDDVGLLVGSYNLVPDDTYSLIMNCYTKGNVTRTSGTGTNFGAFCGSSDARINYSYSTANVFESDGVAWTGGNKGFIGQDNAGTYASVYFDSEASNQTSDAVAEAKTTSEMNTKSTFDGWDFVGTEADGSDDIWGMNSSVNEGSPFLFWQPYKDSESYLRTLPVTNPYYYTAELHGEITYIGASPISAYGFCWNTTGTPTTTDDTTNFGTTEIAQEFGSEITGLQPSTTYYARAYITTGDSTKYGDQVVFETQATPPFTGSGTFNDPFQISTIDDLLNLQGNIEYWDKNFVLMNDIDMSGYTGDFRIGYYNPATPFTGTFDGHGHVISGFTLNYPLSSHLGFFGYTQNAVVKNLGLTNISITGKHTLGGLIAVSRNTTVNNCYVKGYIKGEGDYVGGLIAVNFSNSIVKNSYSSININSYETVRVPYMVGFEIHYKYVTYYFGFIGGLIGSNTSSDIINCYSEGQLTTGGYGGGLVGRNDQADILNCYSKTTVYPRGLSPSSAASANGFASFVGYVSGSKIENCFSTGFVQGTANPLTTYGFVGTTTTSEFINNFYDTQTSLQSTGTGATAKTTIEMKEQSTFVNAGWDFVDEQENGTENNWAISPYINGGYPALEWQRFYDSNIALSGITNTRTKLYNMHIEFAAETEGINISLELKEMNEEPQNLPPNKRTIDKYWEISNIIGGKIKLALYYDSTLTAGFTGSPTILHYNGTNWEELPTSDEKTSGEFKYVETLNYYDSFSPVTVGDNSDLLPVELTSFVGSTKGDKVELKWETATEVNNYGFEIERNSLDENSEWETLGFVQGSGNSNSPKSYVFIDELPLTDSVEYRLKQIDTDGNFTYYSETAKVVFGVTGVNEEIIPKEFSLSQNYPNPFNPTTIIKYGLPEQSNVKIEIFNILGQSVGMLVNQNNSAGYFELNWNAENLPSGIYLISINANSLSTKKSFTQIKKALLLK